MTLSFANTEISRATTFIKFKKYIQNADFELYIEKLQKIEPDQNYKMLNYNLFLCKISIQNYNYI